MEENKLFSDEEKELILKNLEHAVIDILFKEGLICEKEGYYE